MALFEVDFTYTEFNYNIVFSEPFNQATFQNLDSGGNSVWINKLEIKAGQQLVVSLNSGEVNRTLFQLDFKGSSTAQLMVIYTQYRNAPAL